MFGPLALKHNRNEIEQEHCYAKPKEAKREKENQKEDHAYATFKDIYTTIDQQYVDDMGWATNSRHTIENYEHQAANGVRKRNLDVKKQQEHLFNYVGHFLFFTHTAF